MNRNTDRPYCHATHCKVLGDSIADACHLAPDGWWGCDHASAPEPLEYSVSKDVRFEARSLPEFLPSLLLPLLLKMKMVMTIVIMLSGGSDASGELIGIVRVQCL